MSILSHECIHPTSRKLNAMNDNPWATVQVTAVIFGLIIFGPAVLAIFLNPVALVLAAVIGVCVAGGRSDGPEQQ